MNWTTLGKTLQAVVLVAIVGTFLLGWHSVSTERLLVLVAVLTIVSVLPSLAGDLETMKSAQSNRWIASSLALSVFSVILLMVGLVFVVLHRSTAKYLLFGAVVALIASGLARHMGSPRVRSTM